jgi:hypothetical protein
VITVDIFAPSFVFCFGSLCLLALDFIPARGDKIKY